jgi:hypothetical protein
MRSRRSWTTKPAKALTVETMERAWDLAVAFLGRKVAIRCHIQWSPSQGGYVIFNEAGTKMIADR